LIYILEFRFRG